MKLYKCRKVLKKLKNTIIEAGFFNGSEQNRMPDIARMNEYGTTDIPSRPFMRDTINECSKKWASMVMKSKKKLAETIKNDIVRVIKRGDFVPNAYITIYGGWMRSRQTNEWIRIKGKGLGKPPLTDTGKMANSVEYKIYNVSSGKEMVELTFKG